MDHPVGILSRLEDRLVLVKRAKREAEDEIARLEDAIATIKLQPLKKESVEITIVPA